MKFEELEISQKLKKALADIGYVETTPIQEKAIPEVISGKDFIGQSQTGTGKTASYSLPIIEKVDPSNKKTQAIVLCPTRELAVQITDEMRKFTKYMENVKILSVYGGQNIETQIIPLRRGVQIVVGTPGRVIDHIRRKTLKLDNVKMVVLDEADEMLNMGFEEDMQTILEYVPEERQTVLFSATMNERIMKITKKYLKNPVTVKVKAKELTVENIEQVAIEMKKGMKDEGLARLIETEKSKKTLVFCNTKKKVDEIIEDLKKKGYKAEALHGDIKQNQRERIMKRMKNNDLSVLVATDVAARGIDIDDLNLVINYDIPQEEEYYVHRIGRTGRNGKIGKAYTFITGKEKNKLYSIQRYANTKINFGKIPTVTEVNNMKKTEMIDKISKIIEKEDFNNEELFEEICNKNKDVKQVAKALFTMLTANELQLREEVEHTAISRGNVKGDNVKLFFNVGRKDEIKVKDIVGSVAANSAISGNEMGKINILDKFSFVEVPSEYVEDVIEGMKGKTIKGKNVNIEVANS